MTVRYPATLALLLIALMAMPGAAQIRRNLEDGAKGALQFHSFGQSRALTLLAQLRLPISRQDARIGAVILLEDAPGPGSALIQLQATRLLESGAAVLILDSYGSRGLREQEEAVGLASLRQVEDAYAALALLRSHPAIDPDRIALMGLGRGGLAAIEASLTAIRDIARGDALVRGAAFAAIVAQYPSCALQWRPLESIGKPVLIQIGALDDLAGTSHCEDYGRRLRQGNAAGVITRVYPGLAAAWEAPAFERPSAERLDRCLALLDLDGSLTERATGLRHQRGQIPAFFDQCRLLGRRGGGGDRQAAARAAQDLAAFLSSTGVTR